MDRDGSLTRKALTWILALSVVALGSMLLATESPAQQIRRTLSNFDIEGDQNEEMTNVELDIRNVYTDDIAGYYDGPEAWGIAPAIRDIGGTEVTWADFRDPIGPGEQEHFGLEIAADAPFPCSVQLYWTRHEKIVDIPVPWQTWESDPPGIVVDVIRNFSDEEVFVLRERAAGERLPLDLLNWDAPIPWQPFDFAPTPIPPGGTVTMPIDVLPDDSAAFVRYTVARRMPDGTVGDPVVRFVNEVELFWIGPQGFVFEGSLSNFDVHNDTGKPVHDLELELFGVGVPQIEGWYTGDDAWGLFPDTGAPAIDPLPTGGGTMVHWVDEWDPMECCQWRHFGVRLAPGVQPQAVRLSWTRMVKVGQIPLPWQWWQTTEDSEIVTDVIQLSDTFDSAATVSRQWATSPQIIPLNDLLWDNPDVQSLPWSPVEVVGLDPGDQTFLDIQPLPGDQAVYVRYLAGRAAGPIETRVINEALINPSGLVTGTLSNFDVVNNTNLSYTNLELDMTLIRPEHILDWYDPPLDPPVAWGLHPTERRPIISPLPQTEVAWADFANPFQPGEQWHFGLDLSSSASAPCGVQAYWTQHRKIFEIPVPWQTWRVDPGIDPPVIVDVINQSPEFPDPVFIQRRFVTLPFVIPLESLNWDSTADLPWIEADPAPLLVLPGEELTLDIPVAELADQAVLVRYTVAEMNPDGTPGEVVTRFVNEGEIAWDPGPTDQLQPSIIGELSNFDAHNGTGKPVHDLELDIQNADVFDVWDWYRGPDAWGVDPIVRPHPDFPGVTEVTWVDDHNPIPHCEWRHFGLILNPDIQPEPRVRAHWTREVKVDQIPVPWQFWMLPEEGWVRDVIQLSDTYPGPVVINREYAVVSTAIPLNDLVWDVPLPVAWQSDPTNPIALDPGDQASLDISVGVSPADDSAVLVRYTVTDPTGLAPATRFVNEAILGPGYVAGLVFADKERMEWRPYGPDCSPRYDVVRGEISQLRLNGASGGVHDAACYFPDSFFDVFMEDPDIHPDPLDGYYYLVRPETGPLPGTKGTYDTLTGEGRDAEVAAGGNDCP